MKALLKKIWKAIVALAIALTMAVGAYGDTQARPPSPSSVRVRREVGLED